MDTTNSILDQRLKEEGFIMVAGTLETVRGTQRAVQNGTPFDWATNQGVMVIYDQHGRPWIKRSRDVAPEIWEAVIENKAGRYTCAGHVPHSSDGLAFITQAASAKGAQ